MAAASALERVMARGEEEGRPSPQPSPACGRGSEAAEVAPVPRPHRRRHDGFTPKKQRKFFKALRKTGCLKDAARVAGISTNTVRRHRDKWPAFNARTEAALGQAAEALETIAWHRADGRRRDQNLPERRIGRDPRETVRRDAAAAAAGRQSEEIRADGDDAEGPCARAAETRGEAGI